MQLNMQVLGDLRASARWGADGRSPPTAKDMNVILHNIQFTQVESESRDRKKDVMKVIE